MAHNSFVKRISAHLRLKNKTMSDDELEHLRALLAKTHNKPERAGIVGKISRAVKGLFTRPRKPNLTHVEEKKVDKKSAA